MNEIKLTDEEWLAEQKLVDEEIVKALECCAVEPCEDCGNCPRFTKEKLCHKANAKQSLNFIHRLQSERDKWFNHSIDLQAQINTLQLEKNKQKAEIERLTEENEFAKKVLSCSKRKTRIGDLFKQNTELQRRVDELKEERYYTEQDTAKEILQEMESFKHYAEKSGRIADKLGATIAIKTIKEILKSKGVEVE